MTVTHAFLDASTWTRTADAAAARFTTTIDPRWVQGKGAFGGLLCAGIVRAMSTIVGDPRRRVRTLHAHFCAPAKPGLVACDVVVERAGATITTLSARLLQDGLPVCIASATFALPRPNPTDTLRYNDMTMPAVPQVDDVPAVPVDLPLLPTFTQFFEYRWCLGDLPFSSSSRSLVGGWLRFRDALPNDALDASAIAAFADAYPPALLPRLSEPRGSSSVDLTIDFYADRVPSEHVVILQRSSVGDGGTTDERCEVWSQEGQLLATVRQLVALL